MAVKAKVGLVKDGWMPITGQKTRQGRSNTKLARPLVMVVRKHIVGKVVEL